MSRTQKNKATEYHLGQLKAKLAKLRTQLQDPAKVCVSYSVANVNICQLNASMYTYVAGWVFWRRGRV